jgi:hypothetical protein
MHIGPGIHEAAAAGQGIARARRRAGEQGVLGVWLVSAHRYRHREHHWSHTITMHLVSIKEDRGLGKLLSWELSTLSASERCLWDARFPSPPSPAGWPLSWVKQAIDFPEEKLNELRGLDATLYIRFLRGCCASSSATYRL